MKLAKSAARRHLAPLPKRVEHTRRMRTPRQFSRAGKLRLRVVIRPPAGDHRDLVAAFRQRRGQFAQMLRRRDTSG